VKQNLSRAVGSHAGRMLRFHLKQKRGAADGGNAGDIKRNGSRSWRSSLSRYQLCQRHDGNAAVKHKWSAPAPQQAAGGRAESHWQVLSSSKAGCFGWSRTRAWTVVGVSIFTALRYPSFIGRRVTPNFNRAGSSSPIRVRSTLTITWTWTPDPTTASG
jgi:hypothetical protein